MSRISVGSDPRCDSIFPDQAPAILTITKRSGDRLVEETLVNRGGPERPLSERELAIKFSDTAKRALSPEAVAGLRAQVEGIESADNIDRIAVMLGRASQ